jgi:2-polyprenyl-3-methyl-5-hydroxy-6-metoxy-1,4-benzoquinol methylase
MRSVRQNKESANQESTANSEYTRRLVTKGRVWWKKILDLQAPYRWNLRRLKPGFTLDIGCGLGRNLINLNGHGIGIDHNPHSVEIARTYGLQAFLPEEFQQSSFNQLKSFDSLLLSHVAEHMTAPEAVRLLTDYLPLLKPQGQVILITPQESGYRSDPTHVQFMDFAILRDIIREAGLSPVGEFSFPFPRLFGRWFTYNEFISVSKKPL